MRINSYKISQTITPTDDNAQSCNYNSFMLLMQKIVHRNYRHYIEETRNGEE